MGNDSTAVRGRHVLVCACREQFRSLEEAWQHAVDLADDRACRHGSFDLMMDGGLISPREAAEGAAR